MGHVVGEGEGDANANASAKKSRKTQSNDAANDDSASICIG